MRFREHASSREARNTRSNLFAIFTCTVSVPSDQLSTLLLLISYLLATSPFPLAQFLFALQTLYEHSTRQPYPERLYDAKPRVYNGLSPIFEVRSHFQLQNVRQKDWAVVVDFPVILLCTGRLVNKPMDLHTNYINTRSRRFVSNG